jgi:hypothetical protein
MCRVSLRYAVAFRKMSLKYVGSSFYPAHIDYLLNTGQALPPNSPDYHCCQQAPNETFEQLRGEGGFGKADRGWLPLVGVTRYARFEVQFMSMMKVSVIIGNRGGNSLKV